MEERRESWYTYSVMLIIITNKVDRATREKAAEDLQGYIKFVVDIQREILTAGGLRHYEGEQQLLQNGSRQENLWGGGLDLTTNELDFDSMINIRPHQNNPSREILDPSTRARVEQIVRRLLL